MSVFATMLLALTIAPSCAEGPFRDSTLDQVLAAAKQEGKVVMIDFFTTWCGPCKKLDATTWKDPGVQKWIAEHAIALKLDAEKEVELASSHRIKAYPTVLFLKPEGSELGRIVGYKDAAAFLAEAKDALAGKTALARAKENLVGNEDSPMVRGQYADELAEAGRYEEALKEYLWCFDNGKKSPVYTGVRLSFLLSDITRLGRDYPPAVKALEERRDAAEARLALDPESFEDAVDAVAINRALDAKARNVALYDRLRAVKPLATRIRIVLGREILAPLVEAQRYQDAVELFDKPEGYVTGSIQMFRGTQTFLDAADEGMKKAQEEARRSMQANTVKDCARMYEALLGSNRNVVAAKVADHLIEFCPNGETYSTLVLSAARARAIDEARAVGERGLAALPDADRSKLREALATIPEPK